MTTPIFQLAKASAEVAALLGPNPLRLYLFGEAEQGVKTPYAVWQIAYGEPENKLAGTPDFDSYGVQVDIFAATAASARDVAAALRDAIEPTGYIVSWNGESRETDTRLYRLSFTVEFIVGRDYSLIS